MQQPYKISPLEAFIIMGVKSALLPIMKPVIA